MKGIAVTEDLIDIFSDTDLIGYRLNRLFSIMVGEVPGIPGVGSLVKDLFWGPLDQEGCLDIANEFKTLIDLYEHNLAVASISCKIQNIGTDAVGVIVEIEGVLINNNKEFSTKIIKVRDKDANT